ncbi:MAG: glycosyltransferase family 2 protein [Flaviflexus sp.]|nr:glycosyltransferase family 2 protein [Flaviflexus sp.]
MRVHVVTIAYNSGDELGQMLASLPEAAPGIDLDVDIVDNGGASRAVDAAAHRYGARIIRPGRNLGYGQGANLGFAHPRAEWLLLVNPDAEFTPGAITTLLQAAERWPRAGALGPRLLDRTGEVYPSARRLPTLTTGIGHALLAGIWPGNPFTRAYRGETTGEHSCGWLSGACLLLRAQAFAEIGGFDPGYFMFFEDVDLGLRLRQAGWKSVYVPEAAVIHDQGTSWRERPAAMVRAHHASAARYLSRVYHRPYQAPLRAALHIGLDLRARYLSRGDNPTQARRAARLRPGGKA